MITVRKAEERGRFRSDWLDSRHTFSFDTYHDPNQMGFRTLRVINEDRVQPGHGFPLHPHRDMEILSLILEGSLRHQDDLGNAEVIRAGEMQRITAGRGIRHSEENASATEEVHFLQIWIFPERKGLEPSYEKRPFPLAEWHEELRLIGSRDGRDGSVTIRQDVSIYAGSLQAGKSTDYRLAAERHAWLQVISGAVDLNDTRVKAGDGAAVSGEERLRIRAQEESQFILFDLS